MAVDTRTHVQTALLALVSLCWPLCQPLPINKPDLRAQPGTVTSQSADKTWRQGDNIRSVDSRRTACRKKYKQFIVIVYFRLYFACVSAYVFVMLCNFLTPLLLTVMINEETTYLLLLRHCPQPILLRIMNIQAIQSQPRSYISGSVERRQEIK